MSRFPNEDERPGRMRSRAVLLARALMDSGEITVEDLSARLGVSTATLESFVDGREAIPLDKQLCLALLLIDKFPSRAKAGRQLRDQLRAKALYDSGVTVRHRNWVGPYF